MKKKDLIKYINKYVLCIVLSVAMLALAACAKSENKKDTSKNEIETTKDTSKNEIETTKGEKLDITETSITIDGVIYSLPFEVSELEKAGFDLSEYENTGLGKDETTSLNLTKNDIRYYFGVNNPYDSNTQLAYCLVTHVGLDAVDYPLVDASILDDIKYGTEHEKVIELSEKYESRVFEREDGVFVYWIESKSGDKGYKIFVSEDGMVDSFTASNYDYSQESSLGGVIMQAVDPDKINPETEPVTDAVEEETTTMEDISSRPPELVGFEKLQYENKYKTNTRIPTTHITGYDECYKLSNEYPLESNVVMYLFSEDLYYIDNSEFVYEFNGTMNAKNKYCDMGFLFDLEWLFNKSISESKTLESGVGVNLRQYQFSIYPGFYNFYNAGNNGFWSSINNENVILKTLTPNFDLSQEESYLNGKDAWVEIRESSTVTRIYVMLGTPEWYNTATKEVADWAMEIENSYQ